ncbi:MAG: transporter suffix domain-containing protein [Pseudomonadales bacterium]|nr:transporter suffix domain-containing protein [Pseudomonadales bacterium]
MTKMTPRQALGAFFFLLSSLSWLAVFVVPFLDLSNSEKLAAAGSLYLFSQVTWYISLPLLGKEIIRYSKQLWAAFKNRFFSPPK